MKTTEATRNASPSEVPMFSIYFINHFRAHDATFESFETALAAAKRIGFDAVIRKDGEAIACWSILGGLHPM